MLTQKSSTSYELDKSNLIKTGAIVTEINKFFPTHYGLFFINKMSFLEQIIKLFHKRKLQTF